MARKVHFTQALELAQTGTSTFAYVIVLVFQKVAMPRAWLSLVLLLVLAWQAWAQAPSCATRCHEVDCDAFSIRYGKYCGVGHGGGCLAESHSGQGGVVSPVPHCLHWGAVARRLPWAEALRQRGCMLQAPR